MKAIEAAADAAGVSYGQMMENAGQAVAQAILSRVANPIEHQAVVLCGPGNNGGDGLVAAYYLAQAEMAVAVYCARPPDENDAKVQRLRTRGILLVDMPSDAQWQTLNNLLTSATLLVDAVLGTGARLPVQGDLVELLKQTAYFLSHRTRAPWRVAVDCPSGLNCDTGAIDSLTLPADLTVTFAAAKLGQFAFPGADDVGELVVADIGIPPNLPELAQVRLDLATAAMVQTWLPQRPRDAHKGTFGRALVVAGSVNYTGAAYLAGAAAYRIGAGLVSLAVPEPLYPVLAGQLPEATWVPLPSEAGAISGTAVDLVRAEFAKTQALVLGPGWGLAKPTALFLRRLLAAEPRRGGMGFGLRQAQATENISAPAQTTWPSLVVDADALKLLTEIENWSQQLPAEAVLTPHPGEMAVLTGLDKAAIQADRIGVVQRFAATWGHVVVLKGAYTVVAAPDGRATLLPFATAALARAGTGDVLAGTIAGLLAQGLKPYPAAVVGAYLHSLAGLAAARALGNTASVLAGDVLAGLRVALNEVNAG